MHLLHAKEVYTATGGDCVLYSKGPVWTEYVYKSDRVNFDLVIIVIILYFIHEYCMYKRRNKTLINVQRKLIATVVGVHSRYMLTRPLRTKSSKEDARK